MNADRIRLIFCLAACVLLATGCPGPDPGPGSNIIAEFTTGTSALSLLWGRLTNTSELAQSFSLPADAACARVELQLGAHTGFLSGEYSVEIQTDNGGEPSGALASVNASASRFGGGLSPNAWNAWPFGFPSVPLTAGETYWIVCRTSELAANTYANLAADGGAGYSFGSVMSLDNGGAWADLPGADIYFRLVK